jgi:PAS domain S-box-containing protein
VPHRLRLLLVDDSAEDAELVVVELRRHGFEVEFERVDTEEGLRAGLASGPWDVVLCDYGLPSFDLPSALSTVLETDSDLPFLVLSGTIGEEAAVGALKAGARDVVLKTNLARIGPVIERELEESRNRRRHRESERALAESEARKSAILDSALDGVITIDENGRIIDFNPAAERMFGHRANDVRGADMADLIIPPEFRQRHREAFARYLATGEATLIGGRAELSGLRANGDEFPVELSITRGDVGGRTFFTSYLRDLTDRRRAEEERDALEAQLRQSQKMEAIGRLAGGVAHDFNNILLAIRGFAALLFKNLGDSHEREHVRGIDLAAERAADLTRQLLAYSRQQVLQPEPTDINVVVEETSEMLARLIGEDIRLTYELAPGLRPVLVDRSQLSQVILNLAVNARDAMPDGGSLEIRTRSVEVDETGVLGVEDIEPGTYTLLRIADTGSGISAETAAHVFDPYYTTKADGTGLGLATVHGIVQQSGGHIALSSELGVGTTFALYFPVTEEPVAVAEDPVEVVDMEGDETILLVEDAELLRPLLVEVLESYGYRVIPAANGADALELLARDRPAIDLLITDVVMPGMNGRELAERIGAELPGLRVLFTSGYPADPHIRQSIAEGRVAFIQKPYLADELARTVRQILAPPRPGT